MDPRYSITGLLVGFLVGMTGMGGGSLMTPILILMLGVTPHVAVGSDLAYSAITKIVGAFQHHRQRTIDYSLTWRLALGSVPGGVFGVWYVHHLQRHMGKGVEQLIVHLLGGMLILVAIALFLKSSPRTAHWRLELQFKSPRHRLAWAVVPGLVLGFLVGVTSVGSGTLFGVLMLVVFGLGAQRMVGTDVAHAALLTSATAAAGIWAGNVNYGIVANLLVGSIPGVLLGSKLAVKLPEKALRPVLASVLLLSGWKMIL